MAHYAFLDDNNVVTEVIVGKDETDTSQDWEQFYGNIRNQTCKRTSYNTQAGVHSLGGTAFRGNYAGVGYIYDEDLDAFITEQPFPSWTLVNYIWTPPVEYPDDARPGGSQYDWNEEDQSWDLIE